MKQQVLKKPTEQMKAEPILLFEYQEGKEPPRRGHQYGNGIRMRRSAVLEDWKMFGNLYDLPASHAKISSVLRKKKIEPRKNWQNTDEWGVNFSDHKFNTLKA
jgi:hypothetical protein